MKKLLFILCLVFVAMSMQAQKKAISNKVGETGSITGTTAKNTKFVYYFYNYDVRHTDSTAVNNGEFQIIRKVPLNTFVNVWSGYHSVIVVSDSTPTIINLEKEEVTGSPENVQFVKFQKSLFNRASQMGGIFRDYEALKNDQTTEKMAKKNALKKQIGDFEKQQISDIANFIKSNKDKVTPAFDLGQSYSDFDYNELKAMLDSTAAYYPLPILKNAKAYLAALPKRRPGLQFTDLTMQDMEGKTVRLSQWVGKGNYVLVDYWASWCGSCRMEMPNVVDAYKLYHTAKGFEVVGVSFDDNAESWKKAVKALGMEWPQMSDLKDRECAAHDVYGISAIPSNILFDPQGKIVASGLCGEKLMEKLKEIYP